MRTMNRLVKKLGNHYFHPEWIDEIKSDTSRAFAINLIDKLGTLEDIFKLIEKMYKKPVCWKSANGEKLYYDDYTCSTILYNPKTNEIEIYYYSFATSYKVEEYGITWWLKEDKSE